MTQLFKGLSVAILLKHTGEVIIRYIKIIAEGEMVCAISPSIFSIVQIEMYLLAIIVKSR
jgi:hypothetical protein